MHNSKTLQQSGPHTSHTKSRHVKHWHNPWIWNLVNLMKKVVDKELNELHITIPQFKLTSRIANAFLWEDYDYDNLIKTSIFVPASCSSVCVTWSDYRIETFKSDGLIVRLLCNEGLLPRYSAGAQTREPRVQQQQPSPWIILIHTSLFFIQHGEK